MNANTVPKTRRRKPGQVVSIALGNGMFSKGIVLNEPLIAFSNDKTSSNDKIDCDFEKDDIAFTIMVMNYAITSGRWPVVGQAPIPEKLTVPPKFCKVDALSGEKSIYQEIGELAPNYERPAMPGECDELEVAAVWEPEHVEDRLRDYFLGVPNKWVEQLKFNR